MSTQGVKLGKLAEAFVANYLQSQGFLIHEKNFRTRWGEIDLVAQDGDFLVFVEVKARKSQNFGLPEEAVGKLKLAKIQKMATYYQAIHPSLPGLARIDVAALIIDASGKVQSLRYLKDISA